MIIKLKSYLIYIFSKNLPHVFVEKKYLKTLNKLSLIYVSNEAAKNSLKLFNVDVGNVHFIYLLDKLYEYLRFSEINEKIENDLTHLINSIKSDMLKVHQWKALYYITNINGKFYVANLFREHALNSSLEYRFNLLRNPFKWDLKFRALLDIGKFKEAFDLVEKIEISILRFIYPVKFMKSSIMTYPRERFKNIPFFLKKTKRSNKEYYNFIKGKKIALVGPAPSKINQVEELNDFDLIIRLNYRGKEFLPGKNIESKKIDIAYYNGENGCSLINLESKVFLDELKFANFKGNIFRLLEKEFQKKFKLMISPNIAFIGSYNMIPLVLFDLLFYSPKSIKLFKTTFFISKDSYDLGYKLKQNINRDQSSHYNSFTKHNPISQLRYVRNLYLNGIIEVDEECAKILELSDIEYLKILQKEYS